MGDGWRQSACQHGVSRISKRRIFVLMALISHFTSARLLMAGGHLSVGLASEKIVGKYTFGKSSYPLQLQLHRGSEHEANVLYHSQVPMSPFPYTTEHVRFAAGNVHVTGIMTTPNCEGPHPAILFMPGSSPHQVDPRIPGDPCVTAGGLWDWFLADRLTRKGWIFLRLSSRGNGDSEGVYEDSTVNDLANDGIAAVQYLRTLPTVQADEIGLLGFSQGGAIAPCVACRSKHVAFIVLIAAPMNRGDICDLEQSDRHRRLMMEEVHDLARLRRREFGFLEGTVSTRRQDDCQGSRGNKHQTFVDKGRT